MPVQDMAVSADIAARPSLRRAIILFRQLPTDRNFTMLGEKIVTVLFVLFLIFVLLGALLFYGVIG